MEYQKLDLKLFSMVKSNVDIDLIIEKINEIPPTNRFLNFLNIKPNMKEIIEKRIHLPNKIDDDNTIIHYVAVNGNLKLMSFIIKNNGNLAILNKNGETPLHLAIKHHQIEMVKKLLSQKVDLNIRTNYKYTCLDYTIIFNDIELFKIILNMILLDKGVEINCSFGNTYIATRINIKYTTPIKTKWSNSLISFDAEYPKKCGIIHKDEFRHQKIYSNNFHYIDYGINKSFNMALAQKKYHFAEHFLYVMSMLEKNNIDNKKIVISNKNIKEFCTNCFRIDKLDSFLNVNQFFKFNIKFDYENTILHQLIIYQKKSSENLIKILKQYQKLINSININGDTILHFIAREKNQELYDLLLTLKADENIKNFLEETPKNLMIKN